jgi:hypothetical protein
MKTVESLSLCNYNDKKEKEIFLIYNSDGIGCKVIYEEGLRNI